MLSDARNRGTGEAPRSGPRGLRERLALLSHLARLGFLRSGLRRTAAPPRRKGAPPTVALVPSAPANSQGMRVRVFDWRPHLERRGWRVAILEPCTEEEWAGFSGRGMLADARFHDACLGRLRARWDAMLGADVVYLHRGLLAFSPYRRPSLELLLLRKNPRVVFDVFDAVWENAVRMRSQSRSPVGRWLNPVDAVGRVMAVAAAVTVSGENLAGYARERNPRTHVIPMLLDPSTYRVRVHEPRATCMLGWMGSAGNLARLSAIAGPLAKAAAAGPIRLAVVSSGSFDVDGLEVELHTHPWSPESERADLAAFDIGLLPMFDNPEDRGKSPMKLLQYAAAGIPIVASPIAIDRSVWVHGETILYAEDGEQWTRHVAALAADRERRARMGAAARRLVEERYTLAAWADRFDGILREAAARRSLETPE